MAGSLATGWSWFFALVGLTGAALVAIGAVFYGRYRRDSARTTAAQSWTKGVATIRAARVDSRADVINDVWQTVYRPSATYAYQAGGREREGTRIFLVAQPDRSARKQADAWLAAHKPEATVPVWFDPAGPENSALSLNPPSLAGTMIFVSSGLFLIAVGVIGCWWM